MNTECPYVLYKNGQWEYGIVVANDRHGEKNLRVKEGWEPTREAALKAKGMTNLEIKYGNKYRTPSK